MNILPRKKILWLLLCPIVMVGCASTEKKPPRLEKLLAPSAQAVISWKDKVGSVGNYRFVPAVDGELVCGAGQNGQIKCFHLESGKLILKRDTNIQFSGGVGITDDFLLLGTVNGEMLAIGRSQGNVVWKKMLSSQVLGPAVASGDIIIVRTGSGDIFGLDQLTGEILWRYQTNQPALILRANPSVVVDYDHNVAAGLTDGRLVTLDAKSGELKWEVFVTQKSGTNELERISDIAGTPYMDNKAVCAIAYNGNVACHEKASGKRVWSREASGFSNIVGDDNNIFFTNESDVVVALDKFSGANFWNQDRLKLRGLTAPLPHEDWLIVGDSKGVIHILLKSDGSLVGRLFLDKSGIKETPVEHKGYVLVQTVSGALYSLVVSSK